MNEDFQDQEAVKYFFGELADVELTAFEDKFFTDAGFSDWLEEFETDLIDDYVSGEMSATEKMKFEEKYLVSPRRKERIRAATVLWEKEKSQAPVAAVETQKVSIWQQLGELFAIPRLALVAPAILLLILLGGLYFFLRQSPPERAEKENKNISLPPTPIIVPSVSPENSPESSPTPTDSPTSDKTPAKTPIVKPTPSATEKETSKPIEIPQPVLASIKLFPSDRSSGETKKVILKKGTKSLYVQLNRDIKGDFDKYLAEVGDGDGNLISSQNLQSKKILGILIPAKSLQNGNYKITLKGVKPDGSFKPLETYYFSVEKK